MYMDNLVLEDLVPWEQPKFTFCEHLGRYGTKGCTGIVDREIRFALPGGGCCTRQVIYKWTTIGKLEPAFDER